MAHLWKGIALVFIGSIIFSLLYFYVQHQRNKARPGISEHRTSSDSSGNYDPTNKKNIKSLNDSSDTVSSSGEDTAKSTTDKSDIKAPATSGPEFAVFDGTNFHPKPSELTDAGLEPIDVIYSTRMFDGKNARMLNAEGTMELPPKEVVTELARNAARINDIAIIDIEHWPMDANKVGQTVINRSLNNYLTVLEWYRQAAPELDWGYYGEVPIRNYWAAIRPRSSVRYREWMKANDQLKPLAEKVDAFFVSLYTFYKDRERWVRYAKEHISEARRLNSNIPVYVYLWPEYHMSNDEIGLTLIEPEFWKLQLETARKYADGIVIYTRGSYNFDPSDPWWQITKKFLEELNQKPVAG